jgi:hypothetical protein
MNKNTESPVIFEAVVLQRFRKATKNLTRDINPAHPNYKWRSLSLRRSTRCTYHQSKIKASINKSVILLYTVNFPRIKVKFSQYIAFTHDATVRNSLKCYTVLNSNLYGDLKLIYLSLFWYFYNMHTKYNCLNIITKRFISLVRFPQIFRAVDIATGYGTGRQRGRSSSPGRSMIFFSTSFRPVLGPLSLPSKT